MSTGKIVDLLARMRRPLRSDLHPERRDAPVRADAPPRPAGVEVVHYEPAAIHEGVPIVQLVAALNRGGFTISCPPGRGLVIHRIGQHPERPDPFFHVDAEHPA